MYDQTISKQFRFEGVALAAASALVLSIPKGSRYAIVQDIDVQVTTAVVATTAPPRIDVGYAGKSQGLATMEVPGGTTLGTILNSRHSSFHHTGVYNASATELDTLSLNVTAGTGGTPAGAATITVTIGFDKPQVDELDIANFS